MKAEKTESERTVTAKGKVSFTFFSDKLAQEITERGRQLAASKDEHAGFEQSIASIDTEIEACLLDCAGGDSEAEKKVAGLERDRQILAQLRDRVKLTVTKIGQEIARLETERAEQLKREAVERITLEKYPAAIERLGRIDGLLDALRDELRGSLVDVVAIASDAKTVGLSDNMLSTSRRFNFEKSLIAAVDFKIRMVFDPYCHLPAPEFREPLAEQAKETFEAAKFSLAQALGDDTQQQAKVA